MPFRFRLPARSPLLLALVALYFATSLGHFSHNAEFICTYPNLPAWLTSAQVYGTWAAITCIGAVGLYFLHRQWVATGMLLLAAYAACGFDGLGHYMLAPMALHPFVANLTILSEVFAAALLLPVALVGLAGSARIRFNRQ